MNIWETSMVSKIVKTNNKIIREIYGLSNDQKVPQYLYHSALATDNPDVRNQLYVLSIAQGASVNIKHYSSLALSRSLKGQGKLSTAEAFAELAYYTPLIGLSEEAMSNAKMEAAKNLKDIQEQLLKKREDEGQKKVQHDTINEPQTPESNLLIRDEIKTPLPAIDTEQVKPIEESKEPMIRKDVQKPDFQKRWDTLGPNQQ
jgi:hypothetical protein